MTDEVNDLIIIGSGPAGWTAAIYAARAHLNPLVFEGFHSGPVGGQLMTTTDVENFPGFPAGIRGPELMDRCREQALRFGARALTEDVTALNLTKRPFEVRSGDRRSLAKAIIVASGATAKRLDIPGTRDGEFWQKGVTACAVCDGAMPLFRNQPLFVIGGGDSAAEESLFLTRFGSRIFLVHRRDELRASKIMADRVLQHPKIEVLWNCVVDRVLGERVVTAVRLRNVVSHEVEERPAAGLFFAVGHQPNTQFLAGQLPLDERGYICVERGTCRTDIAGLFAAGDVIDPHYRQAITSAGTGCMAAMDAERWLAERS